MAYDMFGYKNPAEGNSRLLMVGLMNKTTKEEQALLSMKRKMAKEQRLKPDTSVEAEPRKPKPIQTPEPTTPEENFWIMEKERSRAVMRFYQEKPMASLADKDANAYLSSVFSCSWLPARGKSIDEYTRKLPTMVVNARGGKLPNGTKLYLPSSLLARRLFLLFSTQSAIQQSRRIRIKDMSQVLRAVGMSVKGSRLKAAQNQLLRLAMTQVDVWQYSKNETGDKVSRNWGSRIFEGFSCDIESSEEQQKFSFIPNEVVFSERFYEKAIENKAQLIKASEILKAKTPLEHDIALWILFRSRRLGQPLELDYRALYYQFAMPDSYFYGWKKRFIKTLGSITSQLGHRVLFDEKSVRLMPQRASISKKQ